MKFYKSLIAGPIGVLLLAACAKEQPAGPPSGPMPFPVTELVPQKVTVSDEYTAKLEGRQNVEIRPKVSGFISQTFVDEGQYVRKGQVLFQLETNTMNQEAAAAKANVTAAKVEVQRLEPLVSRGIISNVQLETAKARLAQAERSYGSVAANISYARITSPVDGFIGSLPYKTGSLVGPTNPEPMTTVSDTRSMRAYFTLNERQMIAFSKNIEGGTLAEKIKNAPQVELILADGSTYAHKGQIATINGQIDNATGGTRFRADFPNPEAILRSGGTASVVIPNIIEQALAVPQNAVIDMQGKQIAYVVDQKNKVSARNITTNGVAGKQFIVEGGLKAGERIVVEGVSKLREGMEIIPEDPAKEQPANQ